MSDWHGDRADLSASLREHHGTSIEVKKSPETFAKFLGGGDITFMALDEKTAQVQLLFVQNMLAVRGFVVALMPDFGQVDDVLQETFLTVTAKADDYVEGSNFKAWACTIARYKVLEASRRMGVNPRLLDAEVIEVLCETEIVEPNPVEELSALENCKESLAPQARRAIEFRYDQAMRPTEIAKLMGWTVSAVNVALSRARNVLRECVARQLAGTESSGDA